MIEKRPLIIFGIAAILILVFFIIFRNKGEQFNWTETYEETSKAPYGTFVTHTLLQDYFPDNKVENLDKPIQKSLSYNRDTNSNYVFIGEALFLDTMDVNKLLEFVEGGNNAFISSKTVPYDLMFYVYYTECNYNYWDDYSSHRDSVVNFSMLHSDLDKGDDFESKHIYNFQADNYRWQYIDSVYFCDEEHSFVELGKFNDQYVNFAMMKYGKGTFYFHTNPIAFSNIEMLDQDGYEYANRVFSHLEEGPIFWDATSRTRENIGRRRNQMASQSDSRALPSEGPLKFILAQPPLAWAWYTALLLGLFYLLFRAKRKQRIIPVLEPNNNTSLEFIATIGRLYFLQNDHKKLSEQKMKLFLSYVRDRYNIPTKSIDEGFVQKLTAKSEIPTSIIEKIVLLNKNITSSPSISENTMVELHLELDKFYQNCK